MKKIVPFGAALLPMLAFAQDVDSILDQIGNLVDRALPIVAGIALLAFFWGLVRYIWAAGDEAKKAEGKRIMIGGTIALFVMVSVWGLVTFIQESLGIDQVESVQPPTIEGL